MHHDNGAHDDDRAGLPCCRVTKQKGLTQTAAPDRVVSRLDRPPVRLRLAPILMHWTSGPQWRRSWGHAEWAADFVPGRLALDQHNVACQTPGAPSRLTDKHSSARQSGNKQQFLGPLVRLGPCLQCKVQLQLVERAGGRQSCVMTLRFECAQAASSRSPGATSIAETICPSPSFFVPSPLRLFAILMASIKEEGGGGSGTAYAFRPVARGPPHSKFKFKFKCTATAAATATATATAMGQQPKPRRKQQNRRQVRPLQAAPSLSASLNNYSKSAHLAPLFVANAL